MYIALIFLSLVGAAAASCSSGDVAYMCNNLDTCWRELAFSARSDLQMLCEAQGFFENDNGGGGTGLLTTAIITTPPRNVTIPAGSKASFRCSADMTVRVTIVKKTEQIEELIDGGGKATSQTTIQEIDDARNEHEGWYVCTAYGSDGMAATAEAYLEIRDICASSKCVAPKVCQPDQYKGTYECVCPADCDNSFAPVCGSDCESYFNECTMKKETCEKGLTGVTVVSQGLCTFNPTSPSFTEAPSGGVYDEGSQQTFSARADGVPAFITYTWYDPAGKKVGENADFFRQITSADDGRWRVEASNCHGTNVESRSFGVSVNAADLVEPDNQCCKVYGDPHIVTFDQMKYDYMGSCSYVIAQDSVNGEWMVYGTFEPCGDRSKQMSCITSITVFYKAEMVQFLRMFRINYLGDDFTIPMGQTKYIGDIKIENKMMKYYINFGDTGVQVMWDGIITSETCLPKKCGGGVDGLCANADCDMDNELDRRGFMNPYTNSWKAKSTSEFGNSWAVDPTGCDMEPEDGALAPERTRPCSYIPEAERAAFNARCVSILELAAFSNCLGKTTIDAEALMANCMFDSCSGLVYGAGCGDRGSATCSDEIAAKIAAAVAEGMNRADAIAMYQAKSLDPACMMGMVLASDCSAWGAVINNDWRDGVSPACPSDEELAAMEICP